MYKLPSFKENDPEAVKQFIREHPFAFIAGSNGRHEPVAAQVPVFIDEKDGRLFLSGHIMRSTDHYNAFAENPNVLAVFTGPHAYISASWYENRKQASTWNYMSVYARGTLKFLNEERLLEVLRRTTNHFENNPHSGANFEDLPEEYVRRLSKAIVAFEVEVKEMDSVFKLSQNRDEKSYDNIMDNLKKQGGDGQEIAELMGKRRSKLFPS